MMEALTYIKGLRRLILTNDKPRFIASATATNPSALALANGIVHKPHVLALDLTI